MTPRPIPILFAAGLAACGGKGTSAVTSQAVLEVLVNGTTGDRLTFPAISAGGSTSLSVQIKSAGAGTLTVERLDFVRTDAGPSETLTMVPVSVPFDIPSRSTQNIDFIYQPLAGQPSPEGDLTIESSDRIAGAVSIHISAQIRAGAITVDPNNLSWADITPMDTTPDCGNAAPNLKQEFKVINSGHDFLQVTQYHIEPGSQEEHFTVCPAPFEGERNVIPAGSNRTWKVIFHPQEEGEQRAFVKIAEAGGGEATVTLRGSSTGVGGIDVNPRTLAWPSLRQDHCGEQNVTIINTGDKPLAIPQIRLKPSGAEDYYTITGELFDREAGGLREAIPAGESTTLTVLYCAGEDIVEARIELHHTAAPAVPSPIVVELKGQSSLPQLCVDPSTVHFAGTAPDANNTRSVVISNCGGGFLQAQVEGIEPFAAGTFGHDNFGYSPQNPLPEIEAGEFEVIQVTYHRPADQVGQDSASLLIRHNDTFLPAEDNPFRVHLLTTHETNNLPPVSCFVCDPSCTAPAGDTVHLDCSCSTDTDAGDRDPVIGRCEWRVIQRPVGSDADVRPPSVTLEGQSPDEPKTAIGLDVPGTYVIEQVVRESGASGLTSRAQRIELLATVPQ